MDILGKRLRDLRKAADLTQTEVAEGLHISQGTYSAYERGTNPSLDILVLIAKYFDTSLDYLLGNTPSVTSMSKRGDRMMQRLARVSYQDDVTQPITPAVVTEFIDALIAYVAAGAPAGPAPINTVGAMLRASASLLNCAAGDSLPEMMDAANALARSGLTAQDTVTSFLRNMGQSDV